MSKDLLFEVKPKYVAKVRLFTKDNVGLFLCLVLPTIIALILEPNKVIKNISLFVSILYILFCGFRLFLDKKNFEVTSYKVYQDRIEFEEGFINHKYTVIKMENVREIHLEQNFIQRSANIGTIRFVTAANDSASLTGVAFTDIENPRDVYTKVKNIYEKM